MGTILTLAERLSEHLTPDEVNQVKRAYYYAEQAHDGQSRKSGEPYIIHPLAVAGILANMGMDAQSLMAAMLHDVIEDTGIPKNALRSQFGETVSELVDGVSKLNKMEFASKAEAQAENFQKMVLAMAADIRVILVKLSDRLHNMRTIGAMSAPSQRRIARETLDIYAPIAGRLGMHQIRTELEDLAFAAYYPMRARRLAAAVERFRESRREEVEQHLSLVDERLSAMDVRHQITWRKRHLNSIYNKMRERQRLSTIMSTQVVSIITDTVDSCYRILGMLHNLFKPVPGTFSDYIAISKANGYQSLHTNLFTGRGYQLEVLIRTEEMDMVATQGIASQWAASKSSDRIRGSQHRAEQWVAGLVEMQRRAGNSLEFIEHVKEDLFPDEVYIFTPKGQILEMPRGATAVDFAYAVHTQIGNSCVGCYVDGQLAPLSSPIQSGQTVEIITKDGSHPNSAWLNFVVTGKARSSIRHFLKNMERSDSIALGRRLFSQAAASYGYSLEHLSETALRELLEETGLAELDDVMEEVGLGKRTPQVVAHRLQPRAHDDASLASLSAPQALVINGAEGMLVKFARCCYPLPGDPILGHFASGSLMVHHAQCRNTTEWRQHADKCLTLTWDDKIDREFTVRLSIQALSSRDLLPDMASAASRGAAVVTGVSMDEQEGSVSQIDMQLKVKSRVHLARVIRRLRHLKFVQRISRVLPMISIKG
ncbi:RelA/SpoT family protein [Pokkaliibacter sp. CJK22405]|uniref:RelA/SpoT family protein n=1 Tax=Pokkaliibacter sp. CJK22405 TaxID=3384615 RepID=UPI0039847E12